MHRDVQVLRGPWLGEEEEREAVSSGLPNETITVLSSQPA